MFSQNLQGIEESDFKIVKVKVISQPKMFLSVVVNVLMVNVMKKFNVISNCSSEIVFVLIFKIVCVISCKEP